MKNKQWPQVGDEYWTMDEDIGHWNQPWCDDGEDHALLLSGNVFKTQEEAEAFDFDKLKRMARFAQVCRKLDEGHGLERDNVVECYHDIDDNTFEIRHVVLWGSLRPIYNNLPRFSKKEDCKQFIKDYHQELLWYFGVEDE
jgi:hypothetical protein